MGQGFQARLPLVTASLDLRYHLGLIAGIIDELGIVDTINDLVGIQPGEIVSAGVVVKAIFQAENKKLKYYQLNLVKLIKFKEKSSKNNVYKIEAIFLENHEIIAAEKKRAGRFVLATNILESQQLSADEILTAYRGQQAPERGFAFLKDPLFFANSVTSENLRKN